MMQALLFDLMGTVVYDPYLEALEAGTGMDFAAAAAVRDPHCWPEFEIGAIDEAEFVRRFFPPGNGQRRFDADAFHRVRREGYRYLPGMKELLEALGGVADRYVASNYPFWIDELRTEFDFDRYFEGIYASCHLGVRKPDPRFFEAILDDLQIDAGACLFIDDRRANCAAAAALGLGVHQFSGAEGLRDRLRAEGLPV